MSEDPMEPAPGLAGIELRGSPTRCPYCHEDCQAANENVVCRDCLARHHADCWTETGRCSSCSSTVRMQAVEAPSESEVESPGPAPLGVRRTIGIAISLGMLISFVALSKRGLTIHGYLEALGYVTFVAVCLGVFNGWLTRSYRWAIGTPLATLAAGFVGSVTGGHLGSWSEKLLFLGGALLCALPGLVAAWWSRQRAAASPEGGSPSAAIAASLAAEAEAQPAVEEPDPMKAAKERSTREKA